FTAEEMMRLAEADQKVLVKWAANRGLACIKYSTTPQANFFPLSGGLSIFRKIKHEAVRLHPLPDAIAVPTGRPLGGACWVPPRYFSEGTMSQSGRKFCFWPGDGLQFSAGLGQVPA